jgi:hypothetical protein
VIAGRLRSRNDRASGAALLAATAAGAMGRSVRAIT